MLFLAREMRSYPSSFYQQQPTSPQRGSSGFGSISGSPMGYSSFPTYAPSVFPTHQTATTSPLATTNNGDQSLWASQAYASAYAQQFQQNHPAYAGSVQNAHLYNAPLTHLAASPASAYNQSSLFPTSHVPSASGILSGHQDQQASFSAGKILINEFKILKNYTKIILKFSSNYQKIITKLQKNFYEKIKKFVVKFV
jgi:hypothetical protein